MNFIAFYGFFMLAHLCVHLKFIVHIFTFPYILSSEWAVNLSNVFGWSSSVLCPEPAKKLNPVRGLGICHLQLIACCSISGLSVFLQQPQFMFNCEGSQIYTRDTLNIPFFLGRRMHLQKCGACIDIHVRTIETLEGECIIKTT